MVSPAERQLFADIAALGIGYNLVEHAPVFTVEESAQLDRTMAGAHTKNLFLKDSGGKYWLVTVPADIRVDLKKLPDCIGCKRVSFGNSADLQALLGLLPGSVTPLGAINDRNRVVSVVIDSGLVDAEWVNVHPLRNSATIGLAPEALLRLLRHWEHEAVIAQIPRLYAPSKG
jgi:Ala-tRNA(Pro) deacylase